MAASEGGEYILRDVIEHSRGSELSRDGVQGS